jgi:glyoxylase I family protein
VWLFPPRAVLSITGKENRMKSTDTASSTQSGKAAAHRNLGFALEFHGVRYQVADVARSVSFYTGELGFTLEHQKLPEFATVSLGALKIFLSGPGASGSRPMPNGKLQHAGGWNRVVLSVEDLPARIEAFKKAGCVFRNEIEAGPAGKQIQLEDPDGNAIELFEPAKRVH